MCAPECCVAPSAHAMSFPQSSIWPSPATAANPAQAQEAHEAIRPTDPSVTAQQLAKMGMELQAARLYGLIRSRALASQMTPAKLRLVRAGVATGFDGWGALALPVLGVEHSAGWSLHNCSCVAPLLSMQFNSAPACPSCPLLGGCGAVG